MKFNKIKEKLKEFEEENRKLKGIIRELINEEDEKEIIKKVNNLRKSL